MDDSSSPNRTPPPGTTATAAPTRRTVLAATGALAAVSLAPRTAFSRTAGAVGDATLRPGEVYHAVTSFEFAW